MIISSYNSYFCFHPIRSTDIVFLQCSTDTPNHHFVNQSADLWPNRHEYNKKTTPKVSDIFIVFHIGMSPAIRPKIVKQSPCRDSLSHISSHLPAFPVQDNDLRQPFTARANRMLQQSPVIPKKLFLAFVTFRLLLPSSEGHANLGTVELHRCMRLTSGCVHVLITENASKLF